MSKTVRTKQVLLLLLVVLFAFPSRAYAYIDPATTTYIIQIVTAAVITMGVAAGVFFTRAQLSALNIYMKVVGFFIGLFSRKEAGSAQTRQTQTVSEPQRRSSAAVSTELEERRLLWADDRPFKERLTLALIVAGAFSFTFVLFGIYELYALNAGLFLFPIGQMVGVVALAALACFGALLISMLPLRGRVFDLVLSLWFALLIAGYAQGNFLNSGLGVLTGDSIAWNTRLGDFFLNSSIWLLIVAVVILMRVAKRKIWSFAIKGVSLLLVASQLVSGMMLYTPALNASASYGSYLSEQGIYDVGADENIVVIILDRLDNQHVQWLLKQEASFFAPLDGFTYFSNNMSLYGQTFPSVTNLLSGNRHFFDRPDEEYLKEAWQTSPFLPGLREGGYAIDLYTEQGYVFAEAADLASIVDNVHSGVPQVKRVNALEQFLLLSAFRYAPLGAKPFFWTSTDRFATLIDTSREAPSYITNDLRFYDRLRTERLHPSQHEKLFSVIHLRGPHPPWDLNEFVQEVGEGNTSEDAQVRASFRIVFEYVDQLKKMGRYEDSTIVILGDHGVNPDDRYVPPHAVLAGLFVKPAGSAGKPLAQSKAPVSHDNFRAFIYEQAGLPHAVLGKTYFEVGEGEPVERLLYQRVRPSEEGPGRLITYRIPQDANDFDDWVPVDEKVLDEGILRKW